MQVIITADQHKGKRGYRGADLELPALWYEIDDALARAHVTGNGGYELSGFNRWPDFMKSALRLSGEKTLGELNLLAGQISRMNETQLGAYEGIVKLRQDSDIDHPASTKELINAAYNVDSFEFHPGVVNDYNLGSICLQGEMLDLIQDLPDEVYELLDEEKVGAALRKSDQGVFTSQGYVYRSSKDWQEVYDGVLLPQQTDSHSGLISLRLKTMDSNPDRDEGVWLELPADEQAMHWALISLGENTFDTCYIAKAKGILPSLEYQIAGDEDIGKLNTLAERIQAFPDNRTLAKYKAVLELEVCSDLDMELDIAENLDCYDYDPVILSPEAYAEYLLQEAGFDADDPAFSGFDFRDYGERHLQRVGYVPTPYGSIARNEKPFVPEYTKPEPGMTMQ
ncbi:MAG: hypothetical protein KH230_19335 [Enterocloster asparagiformis]|nr:hypothetical protein [Enterocloster asparagiformis]